VLYSVSLVKDETKSCLGSTVNNADILFKTTMEAFCRGFDAVGAAVTAMTVETITCCDETRIAEIKRYCG